MTPGPAAPVRPRPAPAPPAARTGAPPAVEVRGVAQRFGRNWVLRGATLSVAEGEAIALLGSNGAGKTTLLRVVATLLRPTRGTAVVFGRDVLEDPDVRAEVGLLSTSPALYEDLTARENLRFTCQLRGEPVDARAITHVLDEVGLAGHEDTRVRDFSSGMRRRVGLARLLLSPPRLLLLDEPYSAFDADGIERVNQLVQRVKDAGGSVIVATHDLPRAAPVVDRVLRLQEGLVFAEDVEVGGGIELPPEARRPVRAPAPPEGDLRREARRVAAMAWKDLTAERRTRANLNAVLFFAALMLLLFGFALGPDTDALRQAGSGIIWLTVLYSGILVFQRSYQMELEGGAMEQVLLSPGDRKSLFLGKVLANVALVLMVEAVVLPVAAVFFHLPLGRDFGALLGVLALGTIGFVTLGTFYAALASRVRAREVLLPLLLFPMLVPLLVGAVEATSAILAGDGMGDALAWSKLLAAFDLIFLVATAAAFRFVIEE